MIKPLTTTADAPWDPFYEWLAAKNAKDAERVNHGIHRIHEKRRRMMFSRVEHVERVEVENGIICSI